MNFFGGPNLAATVETSEGQPNPNGRGYITNCRPITDAGTPSVAIAARGRTQDPVVFGTAVEMDNNGFCPVRAEGRYMRARITLPAETVYDHIQGIDVPDENIIATGYR